MYYNVYRAYGCQPSINNERENAPPMNYSRIKAAIDFLCYVPEDINQHFLGGELSHSLTVLENTAKLAEKESKLEYDDIMEILNSRDEDSALAKLTYIAEFGEKSEATDACLRLAQIYGDIETYSSVSVPKIHQIALGYLDRAKKLIGAPEPSTSSDPSRREFREFLKAFFEEAQVKEFDTPRASALLSQIKESVEKRKGRSKALGERIRATENCISSDVHSLCKKLDEVGERARKAKKRSRWLRRIIVWLIILLMLPGCLNGPGEGWQGFFYFLFLIPNTLHVFDVYEITSLSDFMNAMPDPDERTTQYTVLVTLILLLNLVITISLSFLSKKGRKELNRAKIKLCKQCGIDKAVKEAEQALSLQSSAFDEELELKKITTLGVKQSSRILDELALVYHIHRFFENPDKVYSDWKKYGTLPSVSLKRKSAQPAKAADEKKSSPAKPSADSVAATPPPAAPKPADTPEKSSKSAETPSFLAALNNEEYKKQLWNKIKDQSQNK